MCWKKFPDTSDEQPENKHPVFAVIGRPNVGKSTLVNAILGEERVIAFDMAGTTRDSIHIDFEREGQPFYYYRYGWCPLNAVK